VVHVSHHHHHYCISAEQTRKKQRAETGDPALHGPFFGDVDGSMSRSRSRVGRVDPGRPWAPSHSMTRIEAYWITSIREPVGSAIRLGFFCTSES